MHVTITLARYRYLLCTASEMYFPYLTVCLPAYMKVFVNNPGMFQRRQHQVLTRAIYFKDQVLEYYFYTNTFCILSFVSL